MGYAGKRTAFLMEVEGNRRAVLTGCSGIVTYTEDKITLRTSFGAVTVYGQGLEMGCMTTEGATITGRLSRLELEECR